MHAASTEASGRRRSRDDHLRPTRLLSLTARAGDAGAAALVALGLCLVTFIAKGGLSEILSEGPVTRVEMGLTAGAGVVVAATILRLPWSRSLRLHGLWPLTFMLALAALTALSVSWSVLPDASWQEASRTLAYAAVFCAAIAVAWVAPTRWPALLGGIIAGGAVVCGYALATKVFPATLNPTGTYARLQAPFGYWNATGLAAALIVPPCLWLGARRAGHAAVNALAYPVLGLAFVTLMLAYSRGALLALALGLALWAIIVPLRLRSAAVLLVAGAGAAAVVLWDFSQPALVQNTAPTAGQLSSGHQLGVLLVALVVVLLAVGLAIGFISGRHAPSALLRRRAGVALLTALALVPVIVVLGLAVSHRGLAGSISHDFHSLTSTNATLPPASDPSRLTALGSVRALYWSWALKIFAAHPGLGTGAGSYQVARLHYATGTLTVVNAHGYIVQTLADLGLVGLFVSLALLVAWLVCAVRSTRPLSLRWRRRAEGAGRWRSWPVVHEASAYTPERIGLLTMFTVVVIFGVHSLIDWTWFVPGNACVALLCAGWLAGRGPLCDRAPAGAVVETAGALPAADLAAADPAATKPPAPSDRPPRPRSLTRIGPLRALVAATILAFALLGAWVEWQPLRSTDADAAASVAFDQGHYDVALQRARTAVSRDPLSDNALYQLSSYQVANGQNAAAHETLEQAVRLQPDNPETWLRLAELELSLGEPGAALADVRPALYLYPQWTEAQTDFIDALRLLHPSARISGTVTETK